jgi:hypothetical protein
MLQCCGDLAYTQQTLTQVITLLFQKCIHNVTCEKRRCNCMHMCLCAFTQMCTVAAHTSSLHSCMYSTYVHASHKQGEYYAASERIARRIARSSGTATDATDVSLTLCDDNC